MSPLAAIADFVPDNCGVSGAAPADGAEGGRTGPTSTLAGAIEFNRALAQKYAGRLSRPLAQFEPTVKPP